jgi:hypothetical protein
LRPEVSRLLIPVRTYSGRTYLNAVQHLDSRSYKPVARLT